MKNKIDKVRVIELTKVLSDSDLIENLYDTRRLVQNIIEQTEHRLDINFTDSNYINILLDKTKIALTKIYEIMKIY